MSEFQYKAGLNTVGNYQTSGIPYILATTAPVATSASPLKVSFPSVTKFITIKNVQTQGANIKVGFSEDGLDSQNYFLVSSGESVTLEVKVIDMYVISTDQTTPAINIIAGVTGISRTNLEGNWSGSLGIG